MGYKRFKKYLNCYIEFIESKVENNWAKKSWEKATKAKIFDGTRPQAPLTREEAAIILDKLGLLEERGD